MAKFFVRTDATTHPTDTFSVPFYGTYKDLYDHQINPIPLTGQKNTTLLGLSFAIPYKPDFGDAKLIGYRMGLFVDKIDYGNHFSTPTFNIYKNKEPIRSEGTYGDIQTKDLLVYTMSQNNTYSIAETFDGLEMDEITRKVAKIGNQTYLPWKWAYDNARGGFGSDKDLKDDMTESQFRDRYAVLQDGIPVIPVGRYKEYGANLLKWIPGGDEPYTIYYKPIDGQEFWDYDASWFEDEVLANGFINTGGFSEITDFNFTTEGTIFDSHTESGGGQEWMDAETGAISVPTDCSFEYESSGGYSGGATVRLHTKIAEGEENYTQTIHGRHTLKMHTSRIPAPMATSRTFGDTSEYTPSGTGRSGVLRQKTGTQVTLRVKFNSLAPGHTPIPSAAPAFGQTEPGEADITGGTTMSDCRGFFVVFSNLAPQQDETYHHFLDRLDASGERWGSHAFMNRLNPAQESTSGFSGRIGYRPYATYNHERMYNGGTNDSGGGSAIHNEPPFSNFQLNDPNFILDVGDNELTFDEVRQVFSDQPGIKNTRFHEVGKSSEFVGTIDTGGWVDINFLFPVYSSKTYCIVTESGSQTKICGAASGIINGGNSYTHEKYGFGVMAIFLNNIPHDESYEAYIDGGATTESDVDIDSLTILGASPEKVNATLTAKNTNPTIPIGGSLNQTDQKDVLLLNIQKVEEDHAAEGNSVFNITTEHDWAFNDEEDINSDNNKVPTYIALGVKNNSDVDGDPDLKNIFFNNFSVSDESTNFTINPLNFRVFYTVPTTSHRMGEQINYPNLITSSNNLYDGADPSSSVFSIKDNLLDVQGFTQKGNIVSTWNESSASPRLESRECFMASSKIIARSGLNTYNKFTVSRPELLDLDVGDDVIVYMSGEDYKSSNYKVASLRSINFESKEIELDESVRYGTGFSGTSTYVDSGANVNEGGVFASGDTTLTVQANSIGNNDYIQIDSEILKVTGGGGTTTLTVTRGQGGTDDVAHDDGRDIYDLGPDLTTTPGITLERNGTKSDMYLRVVASNNEDKPGAHNWHGAFLALYNHDNLRFNFVFRVNVGNENWDSIGANATQSEMLNNTPSYYDNKIIDLGAPTQFTTTGAQGLADRIVDQINSVAGGIFTATREVDGALGPSVDTSAGTDVVRIQTKYNGATDNHPEPNRLSCANGKISNPTALEKNSLIHAIPASPTTGDTRCITQGTTVSDKIKDTTGTRFSFDRDSGVRLTGTSSNGFYRITAASTSSLTVKTPNKAFWYSGVSIISPHGNTRHITTFNYNGRQVTYGRLHPEVTSGTVEILPELLNDYNLNRLYISPKRKWLMFEIFNYDASTPPKMLPDKSYSTVLIGKNAASSDTSAGHITGPTFNESIFTDNSAYHNKWSMNPTISDSIFDMDIDYGFKEDDDLSTNYLIQWRPELYTRGEVSSVAGGGSPYAVSTFNAWPKQPFDLLGRTIVNITENTTTVIDETTATSQAPFKIDNKTDWTVNDIFQVPQYNIIDLSVMIEKKDIYEEGDIASFSIIPDNHQEAHTIHVQGFNSTPTKPPFFLSEYEDDLPEVDNFKVEPNESDPVFPKYTWSTNDDDLWYGFLIQDYSNIMNQYQNHVLHLPLNDESPVGGLMTNNNYQELYMSTKDSGVYTTSQLMTSGQFSDTFEGLAGHAKQFGTNTFLQLDNGLFDHPNNEMAVVMHFISDDAPSSTEYLINMANNYSIYLDSSGFVNATVTGLVSSSPSVYTTPVLLKSTSIAPSDGRAPMSVILTFDAALGNGNVKLYIDGKLEDQSGKLMDTGTANNWQRNTTLQGNTTLYVGASAVSGTWPAKTTTSGFDGKIEEVVIYNKTIYPVVPQTGEFTLFKPFEELSTGTYASGRSVVARLFIKDYHNIRGEITSEVASTSQVAWKKSGIGLDTYNI